jgi:predicted DNA-binding transcriptional regulator AlpA
MKGEYIHQSSPSTYIWRLPIVSKRTGLPPSSVIDLVRENEFPQPIPIGRKNGRSVGWISDEVMAWIDHRIAQRNADLARRGIHCFTPPTNENEKAI